MNPIARLRRKAVSRRTQSGIWLIAIVGFLNSAAFSISLPFIALYLHDSRHMSMTFVGLIILGSGAASAIVQLYAGTLSDRLGRRPLLITSVIASTALYIGLALLVATTASVWLIVALYTLVRCSLMMQRPTIQAMVVDICPQEQLVKANGILRIGQNLGWAFGPAIGGYLLVSSPYSHLFVVAALISSAVIFFVFSAVKETHQKVEGKLSIARVFSAVHDRPFLLFVMLCVMLFLSMGQMGSTMSVFSVSRAGFSLEQYGSLFTINGLLVVALQYPAIHLTRNLSHGRVLAIGSFFCGLGWLVMGFVGSYLLAISAIAIITIGQVIVAPTSLAVVGKYSPSNMRGNYQGFFGISETLGVSLGPFLGGVLLDIFPRSNLSVWGTIGCCALLAGIGFLFWGRTYSKAVAIPGRKA